MLKLSTLVDVCRSVAHFCSEQVSVFRQAFNRVGEQLAENIENSTSFATSTTVPHMRP